MKLDYGLMCRDVISSCFTKMQNTEKSLEIRRQNARNILTHGCITHKTFSSTCPLHQDFKWEYFCLSYFLCVYIFIRHIWIQRYMHVTYIPIQYTHTYICVYVYLYFFKLIKLNPGGRCLEIAKEVRNNFTDYNPWFKKHDFHNILKFDLERWHNSSMIFLGVLYDLEQEKKKKRSSVSEFTMATCLPTCIIIQEV